MRQIVLNLLRLFTLKMIIGIVLLSLRVSVCFAQIIDGSDMISGFEKRKSEALKKLSIRTLRDTARIDALVNLLETSYIQKQREDILPYWKEAYELSIKLNYPKGLFPCFFWKANYNRGAGDLKGFHLYMDSAILHAEKTDSQQWAKLQRIKGLEYQQEENYYAALKHYFKALEYYEGGKSEQSLHLYQNISSAYFNLNNLDKAEEYAKKGVKLTDEIQPSITMKLQAYSSIASIYLKNNKIDYARIYLDKMSPYMPDSIEQAVTSNYYLDKGLLYFKKRHYDSSYYYYLAGYRFAKSGQHQINLYGALDYLFKNALKLGNTKLAKYYLDEGMGNAKQSGKALNMITALYNFSDYYHSIGDERRAYEFLQKGAALKDSFMQATNYSNINHLYVLYETDKKQNEILHLKNEKKIQDAELERKSVLNTIYIIIAIAFLLIIVLGFRYYKARNESERQKREIQQQKITELEKDRQLVAIDAMLKGQEEERSRVAKDLHDGVGSMLSGAKHSFVDLRERIPLSGEVEERFDRSIGLLNNTIFDLKKVAQNLMPETLAKFGLCEAIKDFCHSIESTTGIKMEFQLLGEKRLLEKTAETFCYRIIQELVNNAVKYSKATEIFVELLFNHQTVNITVEDNGIGFDKAALDLNRGSGMKNIRYRVDYFNGNLDVNTKPGDGTWVSVILNV